MATLGQQEFERVTDRTHDWIHLSPDSKLSWEYRALGERPFIPHAVKVEEAEPEQLSLDPATYWPLRFAIVPWRLARPSEIPRGAATVANAARKAGWEVLVGYSRGIWITGRGPKLVAPGAVTDDDGEDDEENPQSATGLKVPAIYDTISVQGRTSRGRRFRAQWYRKFWTKQGADGKFVFGDTGKPGAMIYPPLNGGGLHNSKTLTNYLKEA